MADENKLCTELIVESGKWKCQSYK